MIEGTLISRALGQKTRGLHAGSFKGIITTVIGIAAYAFSNAVYAPYLVAEPLFDSYILLTDRPATARWLSPEEKRKSQMQDCPAALT
jgi:hypothetical protein